jgi:hypothetical protein
VWLVEESNLLPEGIPKPPISLIKTKIYYENKNHYVIQQFTVLLDCIVVRTFYECPGPVPSRLNLKYNDLTLSAVSAVL